MMKRIWLFAAIVGLFSLASSLAQEPKREGPPPDGPPPARVGDAGGANRFDDFGPPPPGKRGKPRPGDGPGPGGPGGRGGPGGPPDGPPGRGGPDGPPRGRGGEPPQGGLGPMRGMSGMGRGMLRGGPPGFDLERLAQDDPEMHELVKQDVEHEAQALQLAAQFRTAKAEEREKLRGELKVTVDEHFKVRQARRELQLKRMEEELKRLRAATESRNESRGEIIAKRLAELIGEEKDLEF